MAPSARENGPLYLTSVDDAGAVNVFEASEHLVGEELDLHHVTTTSAPRQHHVSTPGTPGTTSGLVGRKLLGSGQGLTRADKG